MTGLHLVMTASHVDVAARTIDGVGIMYNTVGMPNLGPARFNPGSIRVPADRSAVKLLVQHGRELAAAGYLIDHIDTEHGMAVRFLVAAGPIGDDVLAKAADKTRDGLSVGVEVDASKMDGDVLVVQSSRLREVSAVTLPAFSDSRVTTVTWDNPPSESEPIVTEAPPAAPALAAAGTTLQAVAAPLAPPVAPPVAPPLAPATPPVQPALTLEASAIDQIVERMAARMNGVPAAPPAAPAAPPAMSLARVPATLQGAARIVADWHNSGQAGGMGTLLAALSDVIPANDVGLGFTREQWLGKVWAATRTRRPWVDSLGTPKPLTSLKVTGWQWNARPVVAPYAGAKADIPSAAVSTKAVTATAARLAAGWDVDRALVDLGEPGFIEALFEAAAEDYRAKSDTLAGAVIETAAAVNAVAGTDFFEIVNNMAAAALAIGASLSSVAIGSAVWTHIAGLNKNEVPWWFTADSGLDLSSQNGALSPNFKFWVSSEIGADAVIGYDGNAGTYYEAGDVPIKVEAENISKGGVDLGVFGYWAVVINDTRAFWTGTQDLTP